VKTLHTFGDSHSGQLEGMNWRTIDIDNLQIASHWLGPVTCASFGFRKDELVQARQFINDGDIVCFCFGEIDCRTHIHKHRDNYKQVIDKIIENYFYAIQVSVNNVTVMVMSVPPISHRCHEVCLHEHPLIGSDEDRREYVLYFNAQLKKFCDIYNYIYFDVYTDYCGEDGYIIKELSDGYLHIRDGKFMKQRLMQII
jgi:hypothetical protein